MGLPWQPELECLTAQWEEGSFPLEPFGEFLSCLKIKKLSRELLKISVEFSAIPRGENLELEHSKKERSE